MICPRCGGRMLSDRLSLTCVNCGHNVDLVPVGDLLAASRSGAQSALAAGTAPGRQRHSQPNRAAGVHAGGRF